MRRPAHPLRTAGLLLALVGLAACTSTRPERAGPNLLGAQAERGPIEVLWRSGDEPGWKDENAEGVFWGEGYGRTERDAIAAAEADMRRKAAEYLETRVRSRFEGEQSETEDSSQQRSRSQLRTETDVAVRGMAVEDSYREYFEQEVRAFGEVNVDKRYRALVRGRL